MIRLLARGDTVIGIDNHNNYCDPALKQARLGRHAKHPNYTHLRIDLADRQAIQDAYKKHQPQCVVNLAAQAGVRYPIDNPLAYIDSNISGFAYILEVAVKTRYSIYSTPAVPACMVPTLLCRSRCNTM